LSDAETQSWKLDAATLLKLAGITPTSDTLAILFDVTARDGTSVCLYELARIHGSCRDTSTQLALDFSVVIDREIGGKAAEFAGKFEMTPPAQPNCSAKCLRSPAVLPVATGSGMQRRCNSARRSFKRSTARRPRGNEMTAG